MYFEFGTLNWWLKFRFFFTIPYNSLTKTQANALTHAQVHSFFLNFVFIFAVCLCVRKDFAIFCKARADMSIKNNSGFVNTCMHTCTLIENLTRHNFYISVSLEGILALVLATPIFYNLLDRNIFLQIFKRR